MMTNTPDQSINVQVPDRSNNRYQSTISNKHYSTAAVVRHGHEGSHVSIEEATHHVSPSGISRDPLNSSEDTNGDIPTAIQSGRYTSRGIDRHPPIPPSQVLVFQKQRPGRLAIRKHADPMADHIYGDAIVYKAPNTTRVMYAHTGRRRLPLVLLIIYVILFCGHIWHG